MSLGDIYIGVCESMESKKSELVSLLEDITEPSCLQSGEKFQFLGKSDGENRSFGGFFHDLCKHGKWHKIQNGDRAGKSRIGLPPIIAY